MRQVEGDFTVAAPRAKVASYCADLRKVLPALPGLVEVKDAKPDSGKVLIDAGVSFIKGRFTVSIERAEKTDAGLKFRGHGDGAGNAVDFESELAFADADAEGGAATKVHWKSDVRVHGPLASMSAGLLTPVINQNVERFVSNLKHGIEGRPAAETKPAASKPGLLQRLASWLSSLFSSSKSEQKQQR